MTDRILVDAKEGAALLGISLRTFRYLIKTAGSPAARSLGPRCQRWVRSELEQFAAELPTVQRDEPPQLAAARAAKEAGRPVLPAPFGGRA